jgi:nucleotide-binding universal stress UspA family protein
MSPSLSTPISRLPNQPSGSWSFAHKKIGPSPANAGNSPRTRQPRANRADAFLPARAQCRNHFLGTHGRSGAAKLLLGSIAEEIFRSLECPVLTVGPLANFCEDRSGKFHQVLFATNFSSDSREAAACAVSLALESQAHLAMMYVIPEQEAGDLVSPTDVSHSVKELLRDAVPVEARGWCNVEYLVKRGNAAEKILETAQHKHSDLIVIDVKKGAGVPGASTHLPISTAHKVVSRATCPVLTRFAVKSVRRAANS